MRLRSGCNLDIYGEEAANDSDNLPDGMRRPVSAGCDKLPMKDALKAQWKRRPAMEKISIEQTFRNEILKEQRLTIGMDLGDHWSCYCVLDEAGKITGAESGDDTGSDEADICEDTAESHRPGDGNTFPVGQPAVNGAGIQSNRGACAKGAIDHQEQSKRRST